ncbi:hypothetical protein H4R35_000139 [Dimargaris xerosporica]|nr:hypothetical protein H4R35_000139 [Dimargaris xerosporica]
MAGVTLKGSCHCQRVQFTVQSHTPVPYMRCFCSICRKLQGGTGANVNIMGIASTLQVTTGHAHIKTYKAVPERRDPKTHKVVQEPGMDRLFCAECGSYLWGFDDKYPENVYPFASAIDTPLPTPETVVQIKLDSAVAWAHPDQLVYQDTAHHTQLFDGYPALSIHDWHQKHGQFKD